MLWKKGNIQAPSDEMPKCPFSRKRREIHHLEALDLTVDRSVNWSAVELELEYLWRKNREGVTTGLSHSYLHHVILTEILLRGGRPICPVTV